MLPAGYTLVSDLPPMAYESAPFDKKTVTVILSISIIIAYMLSLSSQALFGMIKNLQYSVHLALFEIPFTAKTWFLF